MKGLMTQTARIMKLPRGRRWACLLALDQIPTLCIASLLAAVLALLGLEWPQDRGLQADFEGWFALVVIAPAVETMVVCALAVFFRRGERSDAAGALWAAGLFSLAHGVNSWPNMIAVLPSFTVQMLAFLHGLSQGEGYWKAMRYPLVLHMAHNMTPFLMLLSA